MKNITKLPKWAQDKIRDVERQRDIAVNALNEYIDDQTPSAFSIDDLICTGEEHGPSFKRRYIQTRQMDIDHAEVHLDIQLRDDYIDIRYNGGEHCLSEICMTPCSFQNIKLTAKKNMRD